MGLTMTQPAPTLDQADILPCPFCGEPPVVSTTGPLLEDWVIRCENPDCMGPHTTAAFVEDAVVQWNQRAPIYVNAKEQMELAERWHRFKERIMRWFSPSHGRVTTWAHGSIIVSAWEHRPGRNGH